MDDEREELVQMHFSQQQQQNAWIDKTEANATQPLIRSDLF